MAFISYIDRHLCLQLMKVTVLAESSVYFIFSLGSLRCSDVYRCESGRFCILPFFLTFFTRSQCEKFLLLTNYEEKFWKDIAIWNITQFKQNPKMFQPHISLCWSTETFELGALSIKCWVRPELQHDVIRHQVY